MVECRVPGGAVVLALDRSGAVFAVRGRLVRALPALGARLRAWPAGPWLGLLRGQVEWSGVIQINKYINYHM